eukprot:3833740-Prymnesium_polylepis.1
MGCRAAAARARPGSPSAAAWAGTWAGRPRPTEWRTPCWVRWTSRRWECRSARPPPAPLSPERAGRRACALEGAHGTFWRMELYAPPQRRGRREVVQRARTGRRAAGGGRVVGAKPQAALRGVCTLWLCTRCVGRCTPWRATRSSP